MNRQIKLAALMGAAAAALTLAGCATQAPAPAPAPAPAAAPAPAPAAAAQVKEYFVVLPEDGRQYTFADSKNYLAFLSHGEVPLTRTRIGAGPKGNTVVFGITGDEAKDVTKPSLAELAFDKKLPPAADFHGEVFKDGRFYVFAEHKDMEPFIAYGEVPYSFTDIGAGPNGETIVWVMNKDSIAKGRPTATIERFKALRAAK